MQIPALFIQIFGVYLIASTGGFIWWMATITEKVNNISDVIKDIKEAGYAKKEDVDKELGKMQKDIDAAHRRIDEIQLQK